MEEERFILHVDMDAFFAAVEQRDNPNLRGKPVIVGANPKNGLGRGVVSTCSYEARKFGVHSAMPISLAYKKCPQGVFLPVDMDKYSRVSRQIYEIFYDFTPDIEPISIDEAFLDITQSHSIFGTRHQTCLLLKQRIKKETGLTASIGLAPTKMAAKIASDLRKPDGLVEVSALDLPDFLAPLDVSMIWGLGKIGQAILKEKGINTIGDLAKMDLQAAVSLFGKKAIDFWHMANGIDERQVESRIEAKSVSNEFTFEKDIIDENKIKRTLTYLCEKVSGRLRRDNYKGKTITLKIRTAGFHTYTRSITLAQSTNFSDTILLNIGNLYNKFQVAGRRIRLVGVRVTQLCPASTRESLFEDNKDIKREQVHQALDKIKEKFGEAAICRATRIKPGLKR